MRKERPPDVAEELAHFYRDIMWALEDLVDRGGTAVGAARVVKRVAQYHHVSSASDPLPTPTRQTRERIARGLRDDL